MGDPPAFATGEASVTVTLLLLLLCRSASSFCWTMLLMASRPAPPSNRSIEWPKYPFDSQEGSGLEWCHCSNITNNE